MIFELDRESRLPLYLQVVAQVRELISRGALKVGDRLPGQPRACGNARREPDDGE